MEPISDRERRTVSRIVRTFFMPDRKGGPWPPPADLPHERVAFEGNLGSRLAGHWFPVEAPRGAVVLVHPDKRYGKHWFEREGWAHFLTRHGYEVLTFDLTGYGESRGRGTYFFEDVLAAARFAKREAGGYPVHVVGVSIGAFSVANASPSLDFVDSLVLESPYPTFNAWYAQGPGRWGMEAFDRFFPKSSRAIQADRNIARAAPKRILVALTEGDTVTPPALSEAVVRAAPAERTRLLRVEGVPHLGLFRQSPEYREAILSTLDPARAPEPKAAAARPVAVAPTRF